MKIQDTISPVCKCGKDNGGVEHYLLDCSLHEKHRIVLVSTILEIYRSSDIETNLRIVDLVTLLDDNGHLSKSVRKDIKTAICKFWMYFGYKCRRFDLASFVFIQFIVSVPVLILFGCSLIFHSYTVVTFVDICDICDKLSFTRVIIISCLKRNFKKTTTTTSK